MPTLNPSRSVGSCATTPDFLNGFGYREANDEDELAALADLLDREQLLGDDANRAPPYYTEDLRNGVAALQRREGFEPADGDVRRGSGLHSVLNELAAGVPRNAFIHDDDGGPLESAVGDGLASDPAAVRKLNNRLAALGLSPRFPDGREAYLLKPAIAKGLGAFQQSRGLRATQTVAPNDDTDRALRQAIADLKRANEAAYRAAHERLAANKAAAEARRRAKEGDGGDDAPPRVQFASFGPDDFSGYDQGTDSAIPGRSNPDAASPGLPPDTFFEPDPTLSKRDDATPDEEHERQTESSFWTDILGPETGSRSGDRSGRDEGSIILAQSTEKPLTDAARKQLEERIDARLKEKLEAAKRSGAPMSDLRRAEIAARLDGHGRSAEAADCPGDV